MIITVSGLPGSGKTSISKFLSKKLKLKYISVNKIFMKMARERGMNKVEFLKLTEKDPKLNKLIDKKQRELARNNTIIDSKLGAYIIKKADLKIYLKAKLKTRVKRIATRENLTYKKSLKKTKLRQSLELRQYKKQYDVDYRNKKLYNLIFNTEGLTPKQSAEKLLSIIKRRL